MARPRKDSRPDRFTSTELAVAANVPPRIFGVLVETGRAPNPVSNVTVGKEGVRVWDQYGVSEAALTGAVHKSGAELIMAAKISRLIMDDFTSSHGRIPSRLADYLQSPLNPTPGHYPWKNIDREISLMIGDDFWLHHLLRTKSDIYQPRTAMEGDMIMEIVDRRYVFTDFAFTKHKLTKLTAWGTRPANEPDMALEIEGWERGRDAFVRPLYDIINFNFDDESNKRKAQETEERWLHAWRNAVGLLRINISLAIRNAFDAIHDHRSKGGSSFDWKSTYGNDPPVPSKG